MFCQVLAPPRDCGSRWSTVSALVPQKAQRCASRRSTPRLDQAGRGGVEERGLDVADQPQHDRPGVGPDRGADPGLLDHGDLAHEHLDGVLDRDGVQRGVVRVEHDHRGHDHLPSASCALGRTWPGWSRGSIRVHEGRLGCQQDYGPRRAAREGGRALRHHDVTVRAAPPARDLPPADPGLDLTSRSVSPDPLDDLEHVFEYSAVSLASRPRRGPRPAGPWAAVGPTRAVRCGCRHPRRAAAAGAPDAGRCERPPAARADPRPRPGDRGGVRHRQRGAGARPPGRSLRGRGVGRGRGGARPGLRGGRRAGGRPRAHDRRAAPRRALAERRRGAGRRRLRGAGAPVRRRGRAPGRAAAGPAAHQGRGAGVLGRVAALPGAVPGARVGLVRAGPRARAPLRPPDGRGGGPYGFAAADVRARPARPGRGGARARDVLPVGRRRGAAWPSGVPGERAAGSGRPGPTTPGGPSRSSRPSRSAPGAARPG